MKIRFALVGAALLVAAVAIGQAAPKDKAPKGGARKELLKEEADRVVVDNCVVSLIEEIEVPGQEPGVLEVLEKLEGADVEADEVVGHIDFSQAERKRDAAKYEKAKADEEFHNDVNIKYAKAAYEFALWDYQASKDANDKLKGTVSRAELGQKNLAAKKAELQIEQAERDQTVAGLTSQVKGAEMELAENDIERRKIRSKIDGVVVEVLKHPGEWVAPGDTVLKIVGMKHLRVEAYLPAGDYTPDDIDHQPVTVRVNLPSGSVEFEGKVTFIHPSVESGQFRVWAEIKNEKTTKGQWMLRPGMEVQMAVALDKEAPGRAGTAVLGQNQPQRKPKVAEE